MLNILKYDHLNPEVETFYKKKYFEIFFKEFR